jgi:hypothetical protein
VATPSIASIDTSVGAVVLVQVFPSDEPQEVACPGASLRSLPTATILPDRPAMPAASKPSREVAACVQPLPSRENQAVERVGPEPIQRPMITKPSFHDPTTLGMYDPPWPETPGRTSGAQVLPSVESHATPLPAATTSPVREATPAAISWPFAASMCIAVQVPPSCECQALAVTSVGELPRLLPTTTSPPCPSLAMPCATNLRPTTWNEPASDRWVHVEPSVVDQTVVTLALVPSMSTLLSRVVKYGPKSNSATGRAVALCQVTPYTLPVRLTLLTLLLSKEGWLGRATSKAVTIETVAVKPASPKTVRTLGRPTCAPRRPCRAATRCLPDRGAPAPPRPKSNPRPRPRLSRRDRESGWALVKRTLRAVASVPAWRGTASSSSAAGRDRAASGLLVPAPRRGGAAGVTMGAAVAGATVLPEGRPDRERRA